MEDSPDTPSQTEKPTVVVQAMDSETTVMAAAPTAAPAFRQLDSDALARVVLLQIDENNFSLVEGFRYSGAAGAWTVMPSDLPDTDLASIPTFLSWFTSRYGSHTLAALLHDHLVRNGDRIDPTCSRAHADEVFRIALDELGVPFLRARLMWTAVTLATRWRSNWPARIALLIWMACATIGFLILFYALFTMNWPLLAAALLAPVPFALLWSRRQYAAGFFGGYTLWLVAAPALLNIAAYMVYDLAERGIRALRRLHPRNRAKPFPGPPSYKGR